ncbi:endonuclease/exonuclease/phosphatase family protein [Nocardioides rubriscoriae]|uniref:endonuclease/exonuclease/phosphatase family protein n=1 Tax=Nocardioides rubriscoriae TaxID=642762 RepID=UPI0011DF38E1|nr:endonuclease/exonuclease/phosphatase family protein [Nocardioides rubriscoriae]
MPRARAAAVVVLSLAAGLTTGCTSVDEPPPVDRPGVARPTRTVPPRPARLERSGPPVTLRVLQYNIQFADAGLDGVVADIRAADADVVLLDEVDDRRSQGGRLQPRYLADRLGMRFAYDPNGTVSRGVRGNAVLTRFDIAYVRRFRLPTPDGTERRGLMNVVVTDGDLQLDVWTTHLNPDVGTLAQARRVRTLVSRPTCTTILGGDLNVRPYRNPPRVLREHFGDLWRYAGQGPGGTNRAGTRRIDYLYFARAEPLSAQVAERSSSDHRRLIGTFRVDPRDNC